jgi:hypothetical protein
MTARSDLLAYSRAVDRVEQRLADCIGRAIAQYQSDTGTDQDTAVSLFSAAMTNIVAAGVKSRT